MSNTAIIYISNSDNSNNITYIETWYCQTVITIAYRIKKFQLMVKKTIIENHAAFAIVNFNKITFFLYISSIVIQHL